MKPIATWFVLLAVATMTACLDFDGADPGPDAFVPGICCSPQPAPDAHVKLRCDVDDDCAVDTKCCHGACIDQERTCFQVEPAPDAGAPDAALDGGL